MSTTETKPSIGCLKVSSKSSPASVAGAIAGMIKDGASVEIQAVGAGAVNQAVKAVAISRGFLSPVGIEICCIPSFADIVIDGDSTTVGRMLHESDDVESVVDADNRTLRLNLKNGDRNIEITVDANTKTLQVREAEPKADSTPEAGIPKTEASKAK